MTFRFPNMLAALVLLSVPVAAQAQAPSKAQQDAIRSNCRSDFLSLCSGVQRGGREALECLAKNQARLSGGCRSAVTAIAPPAPPPAAVKPAPAPAQAAPAAPAPVQAAPTAPAPAVSAPAAPATAAPAAPPAAPAAKMPARPARTATPARPQAAPPPPPAAAPAPAAVAPAPPQTHQPRLGEAIMIRRFCANDFRVLCKGVPIGQGRAVQCLANNGPALSPGCREVMMKTGELR
ncbi:MAG: hypothetical protein AB7V13_27730 [Pseudorhodoplanes sp.]